MSYVQRSGTYNYIDLGCENVKCQTQDETIGQTDVHQLFIRRHDVSCRVSTHVELEMLFRFLFSFIKACDARYLWNNFFFRREIKPDLY